MKKKITNIKKRIINFFKYNKQFCSYVILSLLICSLMKYYTIDQIFAWQSFFLDFALIIVLGSFGFFYKPQKQFTYYFILMLIFTIIGIINTMYYSFYNSFASFSLLATLKQVGEVGDAVYDKFALMQFIYLIFPALFIIIHKNLASKDYFNFVAKFEKGKKIFRYLITAGLISMVIIAYTMSGTAFSRLSKQWNREYIVDKFGILTYQLNDLFNTLKPTIVSMFGYDVALKQFNDYMALNPNVKSDNKYTDIYKDKNIVFIHMESISSFLVNLKINDNEITPNINKLTQEGMFFSNFYPQSGVGTSSDTEFTLNTSLMPALSGIAFVNYFNREYITIPSLLKEQGYYTFSMHANKATMWNRDKMHPSLGYIDFYSQTSFDIDEVIGLGLSDKSFFRQALTIVEEIETKNEKYMGTIITLSNHTPFTNNELFPQIDLSYHKIEEELEEDTSIETNYLEGTKLGDYFRNSHYADEALGEFINYIKNSPYFNDTVFVFYGDHDPKFSLKEYNNYYNYNPETGELYTSLDEEYYNYDYYTNELNRKTPLVIWTKNNPIVKQVDYYMGIIDVLPTIGNMLGIYNKYAIGHDIFEIKDDNIIAFPNGNFLTNKVYYNNSKSEYKAISLDEPLSDDYISKCKEYTDTIIEVSDGIIVHDLLNPNKKENIK
ncbi:MAG: LTA synthase family protein [Bacilli bacterium]|nr:LTA synthase family protein [Bacilli bacterium]